MADLVQAGVELVHKAGTEGLTVRLLGGAAVFLHCPEAVRRGPYRTIADLDAVTTAADALRTATFLPALGYRPEERFNAMHGDRRLIFHGPAGKLDVFVDTFEMCHKIQLAPRLRFEEVTVPVTDLLLTKLQIVHLNEKDLQDIVALLGEHDLGEGPGDHIDVPYLCQLAGADWGLWRTVTGTLAEVARRAPNVARPAENLVQRLKSAPKTMGWKLRARVGERIVWYELPDEVATGE